MENLLKQILGEIQALKSNMQRLQTGQERFEGRLEEFGRRQERFDGRLDAFDQRMSNVEGQLSENTGYIKALLHRTEELDAKFDGLLNTSVTKECLAGLADKSDIARLDARINAKFELLNARIFNNETDIKLLKAVE